jgi:cellulose synthase operon protein C
MMKFLSKLKIMAAIILLSSCNSQTVEDYLANGDQFVQSGDWRSAIIEYKNAVKQSPENTRARIKLGRAYLVIANGNSAAKELQKAREFGAERAEYQLPLAKAYRLQADYKKILEEIDPDAEKSNDAKSEILAFKAIALLSKRDKTGAEALLQKARTLNVNNAEVRISSATFEKINGNNDAALKWIEPLLEGDTPVADAWTMKGEIEQQKGNIEAAEKAYTQSIKLRPYGHIDSIRRALMRVAMDDIDGAQKDVDHIKQAGASWPIVGHTQALIHFKKNKLSEAQSSLQSVLSKFPDFSPSKLLMAEVSLKQNNPIKARSFLEQYLAVNPDALRPNLLYSEILLKSNETEKAGKLLSKLYKSYPDNAAVLALMSSLAIRQKNNELAQQYLNKAITLNPQQPSLKLQLASILLQKPESRSEGRSILNSLIDDNPKNIKAYQVLLFSYMQQKDYNSARKVAIHLQQKLPEQPLGANFEAITYLIEDKSQQAIKILLKTLESHPADNLTIQNLARVYEKTNQLDKAESLYQQLLEQDKNNINVINKLARLAAKKGDDKALFNWLVKADQGNPDILSPKLLLASYYLRKNQAKEALDVLNRANQADQDNNGFILLLAQTKIALNDYQYAIRLIKQALSRDSRSVSAHFLLAQAYSKLNKPDNVRASLNNLLEISPKHLLSNLVLAKLDLLQKNKEDFRSRVKFLQQNYPDNPEVKLLSAKLDSGDSAYGSAIEKLSRLLEETPQTTVALELSANQWKSGDREGAISSLELWAQEHPQDTQALMLLAQYHLETNDFNAARDTYKKLELYLPDQPVVLNNIAWTLKDTDPVLGIKYAEKARKLSNDNPMVLDTLGMLYLETGENAKALDLLSLAAKKAGDMLEIQLNYARVLSANGKKSEAKKHLQHLLDRATSTKDSSMIQNELKNL